MSEQNDTGAAELELGIADRSDRVRVEILGPDRAKFLHNLTTNEVKRLPSGRGSEAFVTSLQGKTLAYVKIFVCDDRLLLLADAGGFELALPHMRKYGVFDDVEINDITMSTFEFHLAGKAASELLESLAAPLPEELPYAHSLAEIDCHLVRIIRESPLGIAGFTLIGAVSAARSIETTLRIKGRDLGLEELEPSRIEAMRIEAGTPVFGRDITAKNLPQEIGRDDRAINFVKGCYLGQETVARLDALGHVNQIMKGLRFQFDSTAPAPGWVLCDGDKPVGVITSTAVQPGTRTPIALAMVRATHCRAGTTLQVGPPESEVVGEATVSDLPF